MRKEIAPQRTQPNREDRITIQKPVVSKERNLRPEHRSQSSQPKREKPAIPARPPETIKPSPKNSASPAKSPSPKTIVEVGKGILEKAKLVGEQVIKTHVGQKEEKPRVMTSERKVEYHSSAPTAGIGSNSPTTSFVPVKNTTKTTVYNNPPINPKDVIANTLKNGSIQTVPTPNKAAPQVVKKENHSVPNANSRNRGNKNRQPLSDKRQVAERLQDKIRDYYQKPNTPQSASYHFAGGLQEGTKEIIVGTVKTIAHPIQSGKAVAIAVVNYKQTLPAIGNAVGKTINQELVHGSSDQRAKFFGKLTAEVAIGYASAKGVDKIAKLTKASATAKLPGMVDKVKTYTVKYAEDARRLRLVSDEVGKNVNTKMNVVVESGRKLYEVFNVADNYKFSDNVFKSHILDRHGPQSLFKGKSRFNSNFDIKEGIDRTLKGNDFLVKPNTISRDGYIFEQKFKNPIGVDSKGKPLYTLKVVIDQVGNVVAAFPKK